MDSVEINLADWKASLMTCIPIGGLISRNPIAYQWKALFRCWLLREAALWRITDLLTQSRSLHKQGHGLGARVLLRSGVETLAMLIYINQIIQQVLENKLDFHRFSLKTSTLLLGSRNGSTDHTSLNISTVLEKCGKCYPSLEKFYADLSESAHPNYEGLLKGYSELDHVEYETRFSNRWMEYYGKSHMTAMEQCMDIFHLEYNVVWPDLMEKLEAWVVTNDSKLKATKQTEL